MFDQGAHLCWRREKLRYAVTHHAGGQDDRFAGQRAGVARIDLETKVALPKVGASTAGRSYLVGISVVADGSRRTVRPDLLEILKLRRQSRPHVSRATDIVRGSGWRPPIAFLFMELGSGRGRGDTCDASDNEHQGRSTVHGKSPPLRIVDVSPPLKTLIIVTQSFSSRVIARLRELLPFDSQAVADDSQARARHRGSSNHRVQDPKCRRSNPGHVMKKGPEHILLVCLQLQPLSP